MCEGLEFCTPTSVKHLATCSLRDFKTKPASPRNLKPGTCRARECEHSCCLIEALVRLQHEHVSRLRLQVLHCSEMHERGQGHQQGKHVYTLDLFLDCAGPAFAALLSVKGTSLFPCGIEFETKSWSLKASTIALARMQLPSASKRWKGAVWSGPNHHCSET